MQLFTILLSLFCALPILATPLPFPASDGATAIVQIQSHRFVPASDGGLAVLHRLSISIPKTFALSSPRLLRHHRGGCDDAESPLGVRVSYRITHRSHYADLVVVGIVLLFVLGVVLVEVAGAMVNISKALLGIEGMIRLGEDAASLPAYRREEGAQEGALEPGEESQSRMLEEEAMMG